MQESRPSAKQLSEQLLRFQHLKALPDLVQLIQSTVESVQAQMEFEEREYLLLQERQIVVNEKVVNALRMAKKTEQDQKKIAVMLDQKELWRQSWRSQEDKPHKILQWYKPDDEQIRNAYKKLMERVDNCEQKIERCIANEILHFEESPEKNARFATITTQVLRSIAKKRFEESAERISLLRKYEEQRLKAIERYQ